MISKPPSSRRADEETGRTALRWGTFDYVSKRFTAAHLEQIVEAAVVYRGR